jgi:hypothetical protein
MPEKQHADWVAMHDQVKAEVAEIMNRGCPFMLAWIDETEDGDEVKVHGFCRQGQEAVLVLAVVARVLGADVQSQTSVGPKPGEGEDE